MIRVACYINEIDKAIALCKMIMDKGYETTVNIMAVSTNLEREIDEALDDLAEPRIPAVYVVDSYGAMYREDVTFLVKKYKAALPGKTIGIHTHNNRQLAFGNTIQAIIDGATMLDASVYGIGRGPGNCCLELLLTFLQNPKFKLRPVLRAAPGALPAPAREDRVGLHHPLHDHRHAQRAPAHGHRLPGLARAQRLRQVLRHADDARAGRGDQPQALSRRRAAAPVARPLRC